MRCTTYCIAKAFNFNELSQYLLQKNRAVKYQSVIHVRSHDADAFYFHYGVVVFWNFSEQQEQQALSELKPFQIDALSLIEKEAYQYVYSEQFKIAAGIIYLPDQDILKKLAIAHGLAQSAKLTTFENAIQVTINKNKDLPVLLAKTGRIPLSRKEISKRMGHLLIERNSVNLHTDILDVPEFFWEHDTLEPFYKGVINNLDLRPRVEVLNKRLMIVHELFQMLSNALDHQYSATLEWIIIILIAVEIILSLTRDFLAFVT